MNIQIDQLGHHALAIRSAASPVDRFVGDSSAGPIRARRARSLLASWTVLAAVAAPHILLAGCVESDGRHQTAAQGVIDKVAEQYRGMPLGASVASDGDGIASQRQALGQLMTELTGLSDAAPGQRSAALLLASQIAASRGQLTTDRLRQLELEMRQQRMAIAPRIDAAVRLGVLASALDSFDPAEDKARLDALRGEAIQAIEASRRRAGELEQPVAELIVDNEASRAMLLDLDREEAQLRAQARSAGAIAGFRFVEQAAQKRSQADALRVRIARNDVQIAELAPEKTLAVADAEQGQQIVQTLDGAREDLGNLQRGAREMAEASKARILAFREEVAAVVASIDSSLAGPMTSLHEEAAADFDKAAQLARQAASPDAGRDAQAMSRMDQGAAQHALAQLHWGYALALGEQAAFLERIASTPGLAADPAALRSAAQTLIKSRDEALEQAKASASEALETFAQGGSETPERSSLKSNLTALIQAMEGKTVRRPGSALAGAPTAEVPGFESPQVALEVLQAMAGTPDAASIRSMAFAFRASSARGRSAQAFIASAYEDGAEFIAAMKRRFGPDALKEEQGVSDLNEDGGRLRVGEVSDSRATLEPTEPGVLPVPLIKSGGRWFFDVDALMTVRPAEMEQALAAATMMQQAGPAVDRFRAGMREAANAVAAKVKGGEFNDAAAARDALQQAIMAKMQEIMSQMMGGMGGGPGGPDAESLKALEEAAREAMKNLTPEEIKELEEQLRRGQVPQLPKR